MIPLGNLTNFSHESYFGVRFFHRPEPCVVFRTLVPFSNEEQLHIMCHNFRLDQITLILAANYVFDNYKSTN